MNNTAIQFLSTAWQLSNLRPLPPSPFTHNKVFVAYSSHYHKDVVLKICADAITHEQKALYYFNGNGCVKLLEYDTQERALLLEYVQPGISLKSLFPKNDVQAVAIAVQVIKQLHQKPASEEVVREFDTINDWLDLLHTYDRPKVPQALLKKAQPIAERLLSTQSDLYLLHGDLHHENILRHGSSWIAIDPKGVIGELAYEVGAFMRNPVPELLEQENVQQIIIKRIELFSQLLNLERQRLLEWTYAQAVLVACWSEWDYYINFAGIVEELL